jgi:MinD superfamily P-loop ATPase
MGMNSIQELVILSGKGGTGKTTVSASLAVLSDGQAVFADCDVDASDLHLILTPSIKEEHRFLSGNLAAIREHDCTACGFCKKHCRFNAISETEAGCYRIDPLSCEGCGVCLLVCPVNAIDFPQRDNGRWMISDTRSGMMVHAELATAAENSGKLVTTVREQAKKQAEKNNTNMIISDGPPGVGCPVIAAITGANLAVLVAEPTVSGLHDLQRMLGLAAHFSVPVAVSVNKWDINAEIAVEIEELSRAAGATILNRISYDQNTTLAQLQGKAVVEYGGLAAEEIRLIWEQILQLLPTL